MNIAAIAAGLTTGLVLGIFGSGGAIIITPALLYLLKVPPKSAIAMGLGIVAVTATVAAMRQWRSGNVDLRVAAIFGIFGMAGTHFGARLGVVLPVALQLSIFALVMYAVAWRMLHPVRPRVAGDAAARAHLRVWAVGALGIGVGLLAGVVGVGGGFLIVPALVLVAALPMQKAVGTSLAIVSVNSYAGFAGYAGAVPIDYPLMGLFTALSIGGSFAGMHLAARISGENTKRGFAVFLLLVATYILASSVF